MAQALVCIQWPGPPCCKQLQRCVVLVAKDVVH